MSAASLTAPHCRGLLKRTLVQRDAHVLVLGAWPRAVFSQRRWP
jgi:hypothetical protein